MLRSIAYIIFLCTGLFAFTLIVLFFRGQGGDLMNPKNNTNTDTEISGGNIVRKLNQAYTFRSTKNTDIFGAYIFNFPVKITVSDRIRMYVFENDYSLIRKNLLLLGPVYTFEDTKDYEGHTMYLRDKGGDDQIVRFITEIDSQVLGFEVLRDTLPDLKALLLK